MRGRRLSFYLLREFVPLYVVGIVGFVVLLLVDLFSLLAAYILRNQPPAGLVFQTILDRLPFLLTYSLAPALAFAVLVGLGRLAKDSELKAAYASGVAPVGLLWPIVGFGVAIAALSFAITNYWQPGAEERFIDNFNRVATGQPAPRYQELKSYADPDGGTLYHAGSVAPREGEQTYSLQGVMVVTPEATYTAGSGTWNAAAKTWELQGVWRTPTGAGEPTRLERRTFPFTADAQPVEKNPQYLPLGTLQERAGDASLDYRERFDAEFRLQRRFADPLAAVVFALVGGVVGLSVANRAWALAGVIALIFAYWVVWTLGTNLAASQALTPALAGWLATVVFGVAGLLATRRLA